MKLNRCGVKGMCKEEAAKDKAKLKAIIRKSRTMWGWKIKVPSSHPYGFGPRNGSYTLDQIMIYFKAMHKNSLRKTATRSVRGFTIKTHTNYPK